MIRPIALSLSCLFATFLQSCNPFMSHYTGTTAPPVENAQLVDSAPADATRLGDAVFRTSEACTSDEALAAARRLGAQYVVYGQVDMGERRSWEQNTMILRSGPGGGTVGVNTPVPVTRKWHEYRATFYRQAEAISSE